MQMDMDNYYSTNEAADVLGKSIRATNNKLKYLFLEILTMKIHLLLKYTMAEFTRIFIGKIKF